MRTVRHLLESKAPEVFAIGPDQPVLDAIKLMAEKRIGALLVLQGGRLVGIVSERDYARKVVLQGRSSASTPVADIMTSDVVRVGLADTADHCMQWSAVSARPTRTTSRVMMSATGVVADERPCSTTFRA